MHAGAAAVVLSPLEAAAARYPPGIPRWLQGVDTAILGLLNVLLAIEVILVFASTMVRTLFNSSSLMGIDEVSPLFLVTLAFMGGAVAYSRGQFIAITILVDRMPVAWREFFAACSEWIVIVVSLLIGGYSIPLLIANAEEKTILLGIGYVWMTLPITIGCALFVVRAGMSLVSRRTAHAGHRHHRPVGAGAVVHRIQDRAWRESASVLRAAGRHVLRDGRGRRAGRLRARGDRHRVRAGDRLGRHDRRRDERAARLGRIHLPGAAVLHPGRLHHGPRRRRRPDRRIRRAR